MRGTAQFGIAWPIAILGLAWTGCTKPADGEKSDPSSPSSPSRAPEIGIDDLSWRPTDAYPSVLVTSWTQDAEATVHVEYELDGAWSATPSKAREAGPQEQVLVGIPFGQTARWRVVVEGDGQVEAPDDLVLPPPPLAPPALVTHDPTLAWPQGRYLLTSVNEAGCDWCNGPFWTVILDRQGRIVWAVPAPGDAWTLFPQLAATGDAVLWDEQRYWNTLGSDQGRDSRVHATRLDAPLFEIPTPGLHHAFVQLPDRSLAWGSFAHGFGEALVEKAPGQPDETVLWRVTDAGWFASNSSNGLFYDPTRDSYLYSFYTNSTVAEIDRTTGEAAWWAGDEPDGRPFAPPQGRFAWQHGVSWTDTDTLLVSSLLDYTTAVMEYEVDGSGLHLVWSDDSGVRAGSNGGARRLPNGNTLHLVGTSGVVREVTPDHVEAWRISWGDGHLVGDGQLIEDLYALVE